MGDALQLANSSIVWVFAILVASVVIFQAAKFISIAAKVRTNIGMTKDDVKLAIKTGGIAAIGPSIGIVIVAISLIPILGDPLTLIRIGIVGSAPMEMMGATWGRKHTEQS